MLPSFLATILASLVGALFTTSPTPPPAVNPIEVSAAAPASPPTPSTVTAPIHLSIPRLDLNVNIIAVGANPDGRMAVPSDKYTVSWWQLGTLPGETGSAVLAGHYRLDDGSPGVFFSLAELSLGDRLSVTNLQGQVQDFQITDIQVYLESEFPTQTIYAAQDARRLNLVTCTGTFLPEKNDYSHRLVIFAERTSSAT